MLAVGVAVSERPSVSGPSRTARVVLPGWPGQSSGWSVTPPTRGGWPSRSSVAPAFAVLKAAGAVGLALGLLGVRLLGIAAAVGLVLFFLGAVVRHVQTRVHHNMAFPGTFLALSVASLALALAR